MAQRPNILFVFTDQQTSRALNVVGNRHVRTPHLDSLAHAGTLFTNAYCTSPVCAPARGSLVTGRMPHETGVEWNSQILPPEIPTLGEVFTSAGYETAWVGPWHLPEYYLPTDCERRGFRHLGVPMAPTSLGTVVDEGIVQRAVEFLGRDHRQPFFLGVSLLNPHDICYWIMEQHPEELSRFQSSRELPPLPENFRVAPDEPEFIQLCRQRDHYGNEQQWTRTWDETRWRQYLAVYYAMMEHADASVGRILTALKQRGLEDDTLVVFTSDHGEGVAAHRWVVKLMLYEEAVTVPFIMRWKGHVPAGRIDRSGLVSGIDLMPTLCDLAGVQAPANLPGRSLRPVLEGTATLDREYVVSELLPDPKRPELKGRMVRTRRFKYLAFSHGACPEMLFDLELDPGETRNLAASTEHRSELERHRRLLGDWLVKTKDPFVSGQNG